MEIQYGSPLDHAFGALWIGSGRTSGSYQHQFENAVNSSARAEHLILSAARYAKNPPRGTAEERVQAVHWHPDAWGYERRRAVNRTDQWMTLVGTRRMSPIEATTTLVSKIRYRDLIEVEILAERAACEVLETFLDGVVDSHPHSNFALWNQDSELGAQEDQIRDHAHVTTAGDLSVALLPGTASLLSRLGRNGSKRGQLIIPIDNVAIHELNGEEILATLPDDFMQLPHRAKSHLLATHLLERDPLMKWSPKR